MVIGKRYMTENRSIKNKHHVREAFIPAAFLDAGWSRGGEGWCGRDFRLSIESKLIFARQVFGEIISLAVESLFLRHL